MAEEANLFAPLLTGGGGAMEEDNLFAPIFAPPPATGGSFADAATSGQVPGFFDSLHPPGEPPPDDVGTGFQRGVVNTAKRAEARLGQMGTQFMLEQTAQRAADRQKSFGEILAETKQGLTDMQGKPIESYDGSEYISAAARWIDAKYADLIGTDDEAAANDYAKRMQQNMDAIKKIPKSEIAQAFEKKAMVKDATLGQTLANFGKAILQNPVGGLSWAAETAGESAPQMGAAIAGGVLTRNPAVGAGLLGGGSYATERYTSPGEVFEEHKLDLKKQADRDKLFNDPKIMQEAAKRGQVRGLVIGAFDLLSGGLAGKVLTKNPLAEALSQTLVQGIMGSAGEAGGRALSGQKLDWNEIVAEGISEFATTPFDMIAAARDMQAEAKPGPPGQQLPGGSPADTAINREPLAIPAGAAPAEDVIGAEPEAAVTPQLMVVDDPAFTSVDGEEFPADPLDGQTVEVLESNEIRSLVRTPDGQTIAIGNDLLKPLPPKEAAVTAAAPTQAAEALAVPDSPRLTEQDRKSPIPNELIDAGKSLVEEASGRPSTFTTTTEINGKREVVTGNVADLVASQRMDTQSITSQIMQGVSTPEILTGTLSAALEDATAGLPATPTPATPDASVRPSIATGEAPMLSVSRGPGPVLTPEVNAQLEKRYGPVGTQARTLEEARLINPEPYTAETRDGDTIEVTQSNYETFEARVNGQKVGTLNMSPRGPYASSVTVEPGARRQGVASAMYAAAEKALGRQMVPSPMGMSGDAIGFWKKRFAEVEPEEKQAILQEALEIGQAAKIGNSARARVDALGYLEAKPEPVRGGDGERAYPVAPRSEWYGEANYEQTGGKMTSMTPDEFLARAKPLDIDETSRENIDDLKRHIETGGTLDPLKFFDKGKEDGRHRAVAAKELGIARVPVIEFGDQVGATKETPSGRQMSDAEFKAEVKAAGERVAQRKQQAKELAVAGKPVRMVDKNDPTKKALVGPDMSEPGRFRITRLDDQGPYSHSTRDTLEAAAEEALREGYVVEQSKQDALKEKIAAKRAAEPTESVARIAGEPDKAFAKRVVDKRPEPKSLPEKYDDYFLMEKATVVPIGDLVSSKTDEENAQGGGNAAKRMAAAAKGELDKRAPITVQRRPDGKYLILDGNGTYTSVKALGWKSMPVIVEKAADHPTETNEVVGAGHLTSFTGENATPEQRALFYTHPYKTVKALYEDAQARQDELGALGKEIANRIKGVTFKNPGLKKEGDSEEKIIRKEYEDAGRLSDAIRAGFDVSEPGLASQIIRELARHFEVLDEGWASTPAGYFDRKILIRFDDGRIAEVQFWEPHMFQAKEEGIPGYLDGQKGHDLYEEERKIKDKHSPRAIELNKQMRALYAHAVSLAESSWSNFGKLSKPDPKYLNLRRQSSSVMTRQELKTSETSTSTQSPSGLSSALASKSPNTTGRSSQLQNFIRATPPSGTNVVQTEPKRKADSEETPRFQARTLREGTETAESIGLPPTKEVVTPKGKTLLKKIVYNTYRIASALQARQRTRYGTIARNDRSPEAIEKIADWMVDEVEFEMQPGREARSGVGWYSHKFQRALDAFGAVFPELTGGKVDLPGVKLLGNQKNARDFFTALIAITSDGAKVNDNFANARRLYGEFRQTGTISTAGMTGGADRITSMRTNVSNILKLLADKGPDGMHKTLMEEDTVANLKQKAKLADTIFSVKLQAHMRMPLSALIFGPKLGAFYANLMGAHGYLTMDRWWSRTFNRYRGQLIKRISGTADRPTDRQGNKIGLAKFKETIGQPNLSDDEALLEAYRHSKLYEDKGFKNGTAVEKAANTIRKDAEGTEDTPWGPVDRTFMIEAVERARAKLAERGTTISLADIQAILWYYEKRLYSELGARGTADISYEEVARRIAAQGDQGDRPGRPAVQAVGGEEDGPSFSLNIGSGPEEGRAAQFVSPSVAEGGGIAEAVDGIGSERQRALQKANREIDDAFGLNGQRHDAIGAWSDGAENTTVTVIDGNASWEAIRVSSAMKGHLADQKAVLIFKHQDGGTSALHRIHVPETNIQTLHENLIADGVAFHTIVPQKSGTDVFVVDLDGSAGAAVNTFAERYDVDADTQIGQAEFIGTTKEDGTAREQRDDARRAYEEVIRQSPVKNSQEHWSRIRDHWGETLEPKLKVSEKERREQARVKAKAAASTKTEVRKTSTGTIHFALSDAFKGKADAVFKDLRAALDKLGLGGIDLNVWQQIFADMDYGVYGVDGLYLRRVIDVSLQAKDAMSTLHHEALHALRALKLFTPTEWTILERYAEKHWITDEIKANYPKELWVEEAIANAFGEWSNGRKVDGILAKSFKKIQAFLKALYAVLTKHDIRTSNDIFEAIAEGKIGRRGRRSQNPVAVAALNPTPNNLDAMFQSAWHGTPHEVDRFTTAKIGTGEGAQAYGWGLYFAGKREVAEWYRNKLSRPRPTVNGKAIDLVDPWLFTASITPPQGANADSVYMAARVVFTSLKDHLVNGSTPQQALDALAKYNKFLNDKGGPFVREAKARDAVVDKLRSATIEVANPGRLYQVDIPENEDLMDYDKYLKDQPAKIQKIVKGLIDKHNLVGIRANYADGRTGRHFYDELSRNLAMKGPYKGAMKDDRAASEAIREAGIPGHRFLDAGSRGTGKVNTTHNYVIYDEAAVEIEARFNLHQPPHTPQQAGAVTQGFLNRGQPIDRAIRTPFDLLGGLDNQNQWKPTKRLTEKLGPVGLQGAGIGGIVGSGVGGLIGGPVGAAAGFAAGSTVGAFLVKANPSPTGVFRWYGPIAENAKRGLIDRYGLDPEYVEAERRSDLAKGDILRQAQGILKVLASAGVGTSEAKVLQAVLTGEAVNDADMTRLAVPIRQAIDDLGAEAVSLGLVSAESFERNRGAYLHRVYTKNESDQNNLVRWVSNVMGNKRKRIIGDQLKGRGLFLDITTERLMKDASNYPEPAKGDSWRILDRMDAAGKKASKRVYWPANKPIPMEYQGSNWIDRGEWEVRQIGKGKATLWRDYTKDERTKMGELIDARYNIAKTFMLMANDLSTGRFYKDVAANTEWTQTAKPASKSMLAEEYNRYWNDPEVQWVKVPDTNIQDTGGKKRWGALAGKYVRAEIWRDLNEVQIAQNPRFWRTLMTQWKLNKTARNPVVHMNNVMSNLMFMDLADVRMQDLVGGIKAYATGSADFIEARDNGAFGSDMISQEIRDNVLKPILEEITKQQVGTRSPLFSGGMLQKAKVLGIVADKLWTAAKTIDNGMMRAYQAEDEIFRMAAYMRRRSLGDDPRTAALNARDQFLNYDIRAPWINAMRNTAFPFISYTYRAVPKLTESVLHRPWKVAKYAALAYGINALAYMLDDLDGGDDDDGEERERAALRKEEQGYTWLGVERMIRMPWRDAHGLPVFMDIRRWIPAGDIFDNTQGSTAVPIPAPLQFGGPLQLAFEFMLNKQAFTGEEITNELTDTTGEKISSVADWAWKAWAPGAFWIPNSWYWTKISNALHGATDTAGHPYSLPQALLSSVGVKVKPLDVENGVMWHFKDFQKVQKELRSQMFSLSRQLDRGLISQKAFDKGAATVMRKFETLGTNVDAFDERIKKPKRQPEGVE